MKRHFGLFAALTALILLVCTAAACTEGDFYEETARELASRVALLASDGAYIRAMIASEDIAALAGEAAADISGEPTGIDTYLFTGNALQMLYGSDMPEISETAAEELQLKAEAMLASMSNGKDGAMWLAAASVLGCSRTYAMPKDFSPRALLVDYGSNTCVLVSFAATGADSITASAALVKRESLMSAIEDYPLWIKQNN